MKNKLIILTVLLALLIASFVVAGIQLNNDDETAISNSSSESGTATISQEQGETEEVYVYITRTGEKFHRGSCRYLRKSKIKISLEDACERGYAPCKVCKPPQCPGD